MYATIILPRVYLTFQPPTQTPTLLLEASDRFSPTRRQRPEAVWATVGIAPELALTAEAAEQVDLFPGAEEAPLFTGQVADGIVVLDPEKVSPATSAWV
jgi:hypothetical protein